LSELLTTKQLQELLKIDRVTVYRMLNDGRLKGVKIGNQWRFAQSEIDLLLGNTQTENQPVDSDNQPTDFPSDCVQKVQEIFAGIIGIGAITVSLQGETLTQPTFCNPFCKLMVSSPGGREACQASWRKMALHTTGEPVYQVCHAGLLNKRSVITLNDRPVAWLIAGQYYITAPEREKERARLEQLSARHYITLGQLADAASNIPIISRHQQEQVQEWTPIVASTVSSILCERTDLVSRLQHIAEISTIYPKLSR
jgi:excisionase family DNA binding protein